jgi:L-asparaginase II
MEGVGSNPVMSHYGDLREVVNQLARRGLPEGVLQDVCSGNHAGVLK